MCGMGYQVPVLWESTVMNSACNRCVKLGFLVALVLQTVSCWGPPALRLIFVDGRPAIDFRSQAGHPTRLKEVSLIDLSDGRLVWQVVATGDAPQFWLMPIDIGDNDAMRASITGGAVRVVVPSDRPAFTLIAGRRYRVETVGRWNRASTLEFMLQGASQEER